MVRIRRVIAFFIITALGANLWLNVLPIAAVSATQQEDVLIPCTPIEYVTLGHSDNVVQVQAVPTQRSDQWALGRIGIPDYVDISSIPIAIADTGANILPEFESSCIAGGYNFYDNNNDYSDVGHHGTDLLNTLINNETGGARRSKVFVYRISDRNSNMSVIAFSKAVDQAIEDGVKIIFCSWGGTHEAPDLVLSAAKKARENGILIISAAGNNSSDADIVPDTWDWPAPKILIHVV